MTREIKFKVWNKDEKHFMVGWECAQLVIRPLSGRVTDGATTPNVELLQYTGLKDSKGVEIYEGDILKLSEFDKGEVDFYKGGWRVKTSIRYAGDEWRTSLWDAITDGFIVVGNVYESGREQS